jgi:hypothetical protein
MVKPSARNRRSLGKPFSFIQNWLLLRPAFALPENPVQFVRMVCIRANWTGLARAARGFLQDLLCGSKSGTDDKAIRAQSTIIM